MCYEDGKLMAYLDDEVSADERSAIAQHLADCRDCSARTAAAGANGMTHFLREFCHISPPGGVHVDDAPIRQRLTVSSAAGRALSGKMKGLSHATEGHESRER